MRLNLFSAGAIVLSSAALLATPASATRQEESLGGPGEPPLPTDVIVTLARLEACREIAERADQVGMAPVQHLWDGAGCEMIGDDLHAARQAHADDAAVLRALDYAARPIGA